MSRRLLRMPFLKFLAPRGAPPMLPLVRQSVLTNTPRPTRLFSTIPRRMSPSPGSPRTSSSSETELPPNSSLSNKLKHLIKSYGWYALGVYLVLSVLDFGVSFAAINLIGAEQVSHLAAIVKASVAGLISSSHPVEPGMEDMDPASQAVSAGGNEGLYAMIVLAYTVHKTLFLPVRVGLTAGFTPKLVRWLRQKGWAGSAGTRRAAEEMRDKIRRSSRDGS